MDNNKMINQVAIFNGNTKDALERMVNEAIVEINNKFYEYDGVDIWTEHDRSRQSGRAVVWYACVKYLAPLSAIKSDEPDESAEELVRLRYYKYDDKKSLSEIGYIGTKSFIVKNLLNIDINLPYADLLDAIELDHSFSRDSIIETFSIDVEQVDVEIKFD